MRSKTPNGYNGNPTEKSRTDTESHASDLTQFQVNILAILSDGRNYGLGIKTDLEAYYGEEINHGRLYPNLDELVGEGLVEKGVLAIDDRTNAYELTDAGEAVVRDRAEWLCDWLDGEGGGAE